MSRPLIIIADVDENYLSKLESKFLTELDEKVEIEIISDKEYFKEFFSIPRTAEIAVIDEKIFTIDLKKHNINHLFVLSETEESGNTEELSITRICKYKGMKEIYNELVYRSRDKIMGSDTTGKETMIISVYSAIGGCGKTSLSLSLAASLAQNHKRVLYINTESIQIFGHYLQDKTGLTSDGYRAIRDDMDHVYHNLRLFLRKEGFSYVPPFDVTLDALNLDFSIYRNLIKNAKESKEYDFIVVDVEAGYSKKRMELLQLADRVMIVLQQDMNSLYKTQYILNNIDLSDSEKYLFVCNKYRNAEENALINAEQQNKFKVNEYVENIPTGIQNLEQLLTLNSMQKLAYMFI